MARWTTLYFLIHTWCHVASDTKMGIVHSVPRFWMWKRPRAAT